MQKISDCVSVIDFIKGRELGGTSSSGILYALIEACYASSNHDLVMPIMAWIDQQMEWAAKRYDECSSEEAIGYMKELHKELLQNLCLFCIDRMENDDTDKDTLTRMTKKVFGL